MKLSREQAKMLNVQNKKARFIEKMNKELKEIRREEKERHDMNTAIGEALVEFLPKFQSQQHELDYFVLGENFRELVLKKRKEKNQI